ncbi:MAG: T9SS type A sorting domain-containing protein [Bacteroidia bacterium]
MKRIVLAMSLVGCITAGFAQTQNMEIRRSDISYAGKSFQFQDDTSVTLTGTFQNSGQNQRWDFSILDNNYSYTTLFLAPDSANGGNTVNGCNLVIQDDDQYDEYSYIEDADSVLTALNNSMDTTQASADFHPRMLIFPLTYGSAWSDSSRSSSTYTGDEFGFPAADSVRLDLYILVNNTCDGHGQLLLPLDSVEALRLKTDVYYEYDVSAYTTITGWFPVQNGSDGQTSYAFFNKEGGYYAATVSLKSNQPNTAEISYRSSNLMSVKNPVDMEHTLLYPNPAQSHFQIEAKQAGSLQIFDLQGKLVQANVGIEEGTNRIETGALKSGQYLVVILYQDGTTSVNRVVKN